MSDVRLTSDQERAIHTAGRSILVSAAAGSGKTQTLAGRCAQLVCGPIEGGVCGVDELLVVTFTEPAAAEMRDRIGAELRRRLAAAPPAARPRIHEQLALLPTAPISTVHSFCRQLIRRWFTEARVDPQVEILDEEEATLLQYETMETLFERLYAGHDEHADAFRRLVEEDFDGRDAPLADLLRTIDAFVRSQPDPDGWLRAQANRFDASDGAGVRQWVRETRARRLAKELRLQRDWLAEALAEWSPDQVAACAQLRELTRYAAQVEQWADAGAAATDAVCSAIAGFALNARTGGARQRLDPAALERAKAVYEKARTTLLQGRLKAGHARFDVEQWTDGVLRIAPKLRTLASLAGEFARQYDAAKRADNVLDFSDLEQIALRILSDPSNPAKPSDIARQCQHRYRHVIVDEFQDTNPVQEAILTRVSRETAPGAAGNLFAVGDVKQCIYAFRLAEPRLFLERAERFRDGRRGELILFRENFRSRPGVIRAVNAVFEHCMTPAFAQIRYDDDAALRVGRDDPAGDGGRGFASAVTEIHLLDRITQIAATNEDNEEDEGLAQGLDEHGAQREAWLIGRRILGFMGKPSGRPRQVYDKRLGGLRDIRWRDIVILLRSPAHKAEWFVEVMERLGIPVRADARSGYFDALEIRDVLALLELLDNAAQDIPLAAVLRSPLAGAERCTPDDMVRIRAHAPNSAFHLAAERYAEDGTDDSLRSRLTTFFARLRRLRDAARRQSLADVLWRIYEETRYLAYVAGLPGGRQRRANLIGLHDRARQFGTFRRQGLRRFLRFVEQLRRQEQDVGTPSAASEADDVVRILSVHRSKGQEFPVVFVADLGHRFNLTDTHSHAVLHREAGLGIRVADVTRAIVYPSLPHQVVAEAVRAERLAEELRILYVAMTRAREHLVLVGTAKPAAIDETLHSMQCGRAGPVDPLTLMMAVCSLDWIRAVLPRLKPGAVAIRQPDEPADAVPPGAIFTLTHHDTDMITGWRLPDAQALAQQKLLARVAALEPLPPEEPIPAPPDAEVTEVLARLDWDYAPRPLTTMPARRTVSEMKRPFDPFGEPDERPAPVLPAEIEEQAAGQADRRALTASSREHAVSRGIFTHRFLQCIDLTAATDEAAVREQLATLIRTGRLPADAGEQVDTSAVAWFLQTDLGLRLREATGRVRRERTFVTSVAPEELDRTTSAQDERDCVLLRGMIDVLLLTDDGIEVVDYKTDDVSAERLAARADLYRTQLDLYARAAGQIWRRPVVARWLVFLAARQIVPA